MQKIEIRVKPPRKITSSLSVPVDADTKAAVDRLKSLRVDINAMVRDAIEEIINNCQRKFAKGEEPTDN
jgi:hypothetical protein